MRRSAFILALALVGFSQTGCESVRFYSQAVRGHCRVVLSQDPIRDVLANPATTPEVKSRLRQVLALRGFAESYLDLPAGRHYLNYVELEREFVVWNVFAAPEFSLDAKHWWYPVIGSLSYRGYFDETLARRTAAKLREQGMDVFLGGVDAYSTLGWFKDPVLDTFLHRDEVSLADLIFHELAHQKLFIKGDTDFNEAFATAVAREGVRRWLKQRGDPQASANYELLVARQDAFLDLIMRTRRHLETLYENAAAPGNAGPLDAERMRRRKTALLDGLRADYESLKEGWEGGAHFDAWFDWPVNNARLNAEATYHEWVPGFENLLASLGGDLPSFFARVEAMGKLPETERQQMLARWRHSPPWTPEWSRQIPSGYDSLPEVATVPPS